MLIIYVQEPLEDWAPVWDEIVAVAQDIAAGRVPLVSASDDDDDPDLKLRNALAKVGLDIDEIGEGSSARPGELDEERIAYLLDRFQLFKI